MLASRVLLAAAVVFFSSRAEAAEDPWFGEDKALHYGVSVVLGTSGYAASALVLDEPWQRAIAGAVFSLSIGAAKEIRDATGSGNASWRDFAWDVAGSATGVTIALPFDLALAEAQGGTPASRRKRSTPSSTALGSLPGR